MKIYKFWKYEKNKMLESRSNGIQIVKLHEYFRCSNDYLNNLIVSWTFLWMHVFYQHAIGLLVLDLSKSLWSSKSKANYLAFLTCSYQIT